jgi:hypothetical protein
MAYNFVRFGSLFDVGYWMIPGILDEPWFSHGLFSLQYIPKTSRPSSRAAYFHLHGSLHGCNP